jgi:hypothetical protein
MIVIKTNIKRNQSQAYPQINTTKRPENKDNHESLEGEEQLNRHKK